MFLNSWAEWKQNRTDVSKVVRDGGLSQRAMGITQDSLRRMRRDDTLTRTLNLDFPDSPISHLIGLCEETIWTKDASQDFYFLVLN